MVQWPTVTHQLTCLRAAEGLQCHNGAQALRAVFAPLIHVQACEKPFIWTEANIANNWIFQLEKVTVESTLSNRFDQDINNKSHSTGSICGGCKWRHEGGV